MEIQAPFVLFDDARMRTDTRLYVDPVRVLSCSRAENVAATLAEIDQAIADGFHVAGYLAYELGYLLEDKFAANLPVNSDQPLIWMGVFKAVQKLSPQATSAFMDVWAQQPHSVSTPQPTITRDKYLSTVAAIQDHIRAGDVYQINYTFKQRFDFSGSAKALYAQLRQRQRASYAAMIALQDRHILSLSPELFYETKDGLARTRPMKGTAPRGVQPNADQALRQWLCHDEKSKAENLMIVDLLRNDLGKISQVGTVKVTDLFTVETYPTLHQMTSGIEAKLHLGTPFSAIIGALFPCGSITGAPKVKAMEIINAIEDEPRGVYTGAIGYASIEDGARFNVAIRTLTLDNDGHGEMGIGSGIVFDSNPQDEWQECHLKANFVTDPQQAPFQLLETLKWNAEDGFALLQRHLDRLQASAAYFCYPFDGDKITTALNAAVKDQILEQRVRLTLDAHGVIMTEIQPLIIPAKMTYTIGEHVIDTESPFTYHKTTNRAFYDTARASQGADEVLFLNAQGHLTEGSITNIFVQKNGQMLTPALSSGLLNGTLRQDLIENGHVIEAILTPKDLHAPNTVFLGNSVRGLIPSHRL